MEHILSGLFFSGYNLLNTFLYTVIVFAGYVCFYKFLKRHLPSIKIDKWFVYSVLSFVFFGALLRILEQEYTGVWLIEASNSPLEIGFYFHTPGWLLFLAVFFVVCFFISVLLSREKYKYYKILIPIGLLCSLPLLVYELVNVNHIWVLLCVVFSVVFVYLSIRLIFKRLNSRVLDNQDNRLITLSQTLDSFATFFGYLFFRDVLYEQHPVSRLVFSLAPFAFPILKLLFSFLFIYVVDKEIRDKEQNTYFKLLVVVLGFLTGIRDLLTISLLNI